MPQPRVKVAREAADVSPKVTAPTTVAFLVAIIDSIAAGDVDPVKYGIAVTVGLFGYFVKDKISFLSVDDGQISVDLEEIDDYL